MFGLQTSFDPNANIFGPIDSVVLNLFTAAHADNYI